MTDRPTAPVITPTLADLLADLSVSEELDPLVATVDAVAERMVPGGRFGRLLRGDPWPGHTVHPMLTDLTIGFWTSANVLDILGLRHRRAADLMVALGIASAAPTALAGLTDWAQLDERRRRIAAVHAVATTTATGLYTLSLVARLRGRRFRGVALALLGAGAATAGGVIGGHLVYRESAGVVPLDPGTLVDRPS